MQPRTGDPPSAGMSSALGVVAARPARYLARSAPGSQANVKALRAVCTICVRVRSAARSTAVRFSFPGTVWLAWEAQPHNREGRVDTGNGDKPAQHFLDEPGRDRNEKLPT